MIINIVGSPCSGKSTLACELFVNLKKKHADVEYANEYVKSLIWENKMEEINDQYYVTRGQYRIIKALSEKVEYVICDSPLFLSLFYNEYNENNISNVEKTEKFILEKMKEFENDSIYIFLERNEDLKYSSIGRIHSHEESKKIQKRLKELLIFHKIKYTTFKVSIDNISKVMKLIEN